MPKKAALLSRQTSRLLSLLSAASLNGTISVAAASGIFKPENALFIGSLLIAGPGSLITAILLEGDARERIITAVMAGIIATAIVVFAALLGPKLMTFFNLAIMKLFGGIALATIALMMIGVRIPERLPLLIMLFGFFIGLLWGN